MHVRRQAKSVVAKLIKSYGREDARKIIAWYMNSRGRAVIGNVVASILSSILLFKKKHISYQYIINMKLLHIIVFYSSSPFSFSTIYAVSSFSSVVTNTTTANGSLVFESNCKPKKFLVYKLNSLGVSSFCKCFNLFCVPLLLPGNIFEVKYELDNNILFGILNFSTALLNCSLTVNLDIFYTTPHNTTDR